MSEPLLLPVKPKSLNANDRAALSKAGIIVIEHDEPSSLRLIRPCAEISSDEMFSLALQSLTCSEGSGATIQRETFTKLLARHVGKKAQK